MKQIHETQIPLKEADPRIPASLSDLIDLLMKKDPASRPENAAAMMRAVEAVARDMGADLADPDEDDDGLPGSGDGSNDTISGYNTEFMATIQYDEDAPFPLADIQPAAGGSPGRIGSALEPVNDSETIVTAMLTPDSRIAGPADPSMIGGTADREVVDAEVEFVAADVPPWGTSRAILDIQHKTERGSGSWRIRKTSFVLDD